MHVLVDQSVFLQDKHQVFVISMNIPDGHDFINAAPFAGDDTAEEGRMNQKKQKGDRQQTGSLQSFLSFRFFHVRIAHVILNSTF